MYRQPHVALWEGKEGFRQLALGAKHACMLAKSFLEEDCDVAITDVLTNDTARIYRAGLKDSDYRIVRLMPTWEESLKRLRGKGTISDDEALFIYKLQEQLSNFDHTIDNTNLKPESVLMELENFFTNKKWRGKLSWWQ